MFQKKRFEIFLLLVVILLGFILRITGVNWDHNFHLHPDERFLTMVGNSMRMPTTLQLYLDPERSTVNPTNIGYTNYVYGVFPVLLNKALAVTLHNDTYNLFTLQGRALSALFDTVAIVLVYAIVRILKHTFTLQPFTPLLAAFFYSIAVLPIQLSHFFTVDTFMHTFVLMSVYFAMQKKYIASGVGFGLAIASKISAIFVFPLIILCFLTFFDDKCTQSKKIQRTKKRFIFLAFMGLSAFAAATYLTLRVTNPYMFESVSFFSPLPSHSFIQSLLDLKKLENPSVWFPPSVQWIHKTPLFGITNILLFGLGVPYFVLMVCGVIVLLQRHRSLFALGFVIWVFGFLTYQSFQFTKNMRYFLTLYPYFALFAAIGFSSLVIAPSMHTGTIRKEGRGLWFYLGLIFLVLSVSWTVSFMGIYMREHTRVQATRWIYAHIPTDAQILSEHWDDALPLPLTDGKIYSISELPVFGEDTVEKWKQMETLLQSSSYYILSSNRGWGSISTVPERYPRMSKFYTDLFSGKTSYMKVAEFTSYPLFNDDWADESFTVYDHPKVMIFHNTKNSLASQ